MRAAGCSVVIAEMIAARPAAEWIESLEAAGVPCGPIQDLEQVFQTPQVIARGMRVDITREDAGPVRLVANPVKFSATPVRHELPPPRLGEHTDAVLREVLGLGDADIAGLRAQGAL